MPERPRFTNFPSYEENLRTLLPLSWEEGMEHDFARSQLQQIASSHIDHATTFSRDVIQIIKGVKPLMRRIMPTQIEPEELSMQNLEAGFIALVGRQIAANVTPVEGAAPKDSAERKARLTGYATGISLREIRKGLTSTEEHVRLLHMEGSFVVLQAGFSRIESTRQIVMSRRWKEQLQETVFNPEAEALFRQGMHELIYLPPIEQLGDRSSDRTEPYWGQITPTDIFSPNSRSTS